jgi:hypothetical protein
MSLSCYMLFLASLLRGEEYERVETMNVPNYLLGPWAAYLLDEDGFAYSGVEEIDEDRREDEEFQVAIVRRSGMPKLVGDRRYRMAGFVVPGDLIWVVEDELKLPGDDHLPGAAAWLQRAQAMATGLNLIGGTN